MGGVHTGLAHAEHHADLCVVGGGLAGLCAAVAAARRGARVVLVHDRPVLGGNASSEVRMWVCGAQGPGNRETGIIEEIMLDNLAVNPGRSYSLWDAVLYGKAAEEPNIELLLNSSCASATMAAEPPNGGRPRISSITAWQLTTQTWHTVHASLFADCSGDSILAPLSGADFRMGREAAAEHGEDIEPELADASTMGMSLLLMAREYDRPQPFTPPVWANTYPTDASLPHRDHSIRTTNWWWIELGGQGHTIDDTETLRDDLLRVALGVWDHVKNHGDHGAENWSLDWMGFLPGKRESRRMLGDHIVTQSDVRAGGPFRDTVAYGGWSMDDHHPAGFAHPGPPTIFHPAPSPYGLPYRALYSRNIANLLFAGRNISATHAAMSSTRVMATCAILGQAVGTAAALAVTQACGPKDVYDRHLGELQQALMDDDCYLPHFTRAVSGICQPGAATLTAFRGDAEPLRSGTDRPMASEEHAWDASPGDWAEYRFAEPVTIARARLVFDSDLCRTAPNMPCNYPMSAEWPGIPRAMTKAFRLEAQLAEDEGWRVVAEVTRNHQRLVNLTLNLPRGKRVRAVRLTPLSSWGAAVCRVFAWEVS